MTYDLGNANCHNGYSNDLNHLMILTTTGRFVCISSLTSKSVNSII